MDLKEFGQINIGDSKILPILQLHDTNALMPVEYIKADMDRYFTLGVYDDHWNLLTTLR